MKRRRVPAGWMTYADQAADELGLMLALWFFPRRHLTPFLLLFVPADSLVWLLCTVLGTNLQATTSEINVSEAL